MSYSVMTEHQKNGEMKFREGRYHEAEQSFSAAFHEAEQYTPPNAYLAQQAKRLGVFYLAQHRFEAAEPLFRQALGMEINLYGPDHLEVGKSLNHLGLLYQVFGRYPQSEQAYRQALKIVENARYQKHPSSDSKLHYLTLHLLSMVLCALDRRDDAMELCKEAAAKVGRNAGPSGRDLSMDLHEVTVRYCDGESCVDAKSTCDWLLLLFSEQLQREYLGSAVPQKHFEPLELKDQEGMMRFADQILSRYEEMWRPAEIGRDEPLPAGRITPSASALATGTLRPNSELLRLVEEGWRP